MKYPLLVLIGFLLWLGETAYFGWNETAQSGAEFALDFASTLMVVWGVLGDILSNIHYVKKTVVQAQICPNCEKTND